MSDLSLKKPVGLGLGIVCAAVALSAAVGAPLTLFAAKPLYFMLGFEVVILVAAIFGVLVAIGRFTEGPGLALLCVAAIVGVGSLLGDQTAKLSNLMSGPVVRHVQTSQIDWDITLFLALRAFAAVLIGAGAAWVVLSRRPRESSVSLVRGLVAAGLLLAVVGGSWAMRAPIGNLGPFIATLVALTVGVLALAFFAAAVHFIVRAFEFGRIREPGPVASTASVAKSPKTA